MFKENKDVDISNFIKELKEKPLTNLTKKEKITIKDSNDWNNIVEALYWIRNNLFHGHKLPNNKRDQKLVEIGYNLLSGFNDYLIRMNNE